MAREVWGTYSVNDHCAPRAFIADVILYDRLAVPVPPKEDREFWEAQGWNPERQDKILKILGEHAIRIEWNKERRERWKTRYIAGTNLANNLGDWAFMATRTELTNDLPRHITGVEAVTTYTSYEDLSNDLSIKPHEAPVGLYGGTVAAIIGHEFLVPDDPDLSYEELLKKAVSLASKPTYRRKRASFWRWHREFLDDKGITDQLAVKAAIKEMEGLLKEETAIIRRSRIRTTVQYAFMIGSVTLGLLGGPLSPIALGGAFVSVGQFVADKLLKEEGSLEPKPVALLYDARKHFGWK